jgi:hypothetical protein
MMCLYAPVEWAIHVIDLAKGRLFFSIGFMRWPSEKFSHYHIFAQEVVFA